MVPLLVLVVSLAWCAVACPGPVVDEIPVEVEEEADPPSVGRVAPRCPDRCAACHAPRLHGYFFLFTNSPVVIAVDIVTKLNTCGVDVLNAVLEIGYRCSLPSVAVKCDQVVGHFVPAKIGGTESAIRVSPASIVWCVIV